MNFNLCCFTGLSTGLLESDFSWYGKWLFTVWKVHFPPLGMKLRGLQSCTWRMWPDSHAWPGPMTNALCSSHTQIISRTHTFIVLSQFFESLYSFFWDQSSLPCAHSCFFEQAPHYWDLLDVGTPAFILMQEDTQLSSQKPALWWLFQKSGKAAIFNHYCLMFWRC